MKISDLQRREVINVVDGKRLGYAYDLELDLENGRIQSIIIPGSNRFFGFFGGLPEVIIPWRCIVKIGVDCILVRLETTGGMLSDTFGK